MSSEKQGSACEQFPRQSIKAVFKFLSEEEISTLCPYTTLQTWPAEAVIMKEGEPGDFMGFLLSGKLSVRKETSFPGKEVLMAILEKGSLVGEASIVNPSHRNATVVALEKSDLLILTFENMAKLIEANPSLAVKLLQRIIHVVSLRFSKTVERLSKLLEPF